MQHITGVSNVQRVCKTIAACMSEHSGVDRWRTRPRRELSERRNKVTNLAANHGNAN